MGLGCGTDAGMDWERLVSEARLMPPDMAERSLGNARVLTDVPELQRGARRHRLLACCGTVCPAAFVAALPMPTMQGLAVAGTGLVAWWALSAARAACRPAPLSTALTRLYGFPVLAPDGMRRGFVSVAVASRDGLWHEGLLFVSRHGTRFRVALFDGRSMPIRPLAGGMTGGSR